VTETFAGVSRPQSEHEVQIHRVDLDDDTWPAEAGLPASERERAAGILSPRGRRRWVASRWALRMALAERLDEDPGAIEIRVGPRGKPELAERSRHSPHPGGANVGCALRFNLSHSAGVALIAIGRGCEVGVDVEWVDPGRDVLALARRGLDPVAVAAVWEVPPVERPRAFYDAWARREAVAKCLGVGLGAPLPEVPVTVTEVDAGPGFAAALATAALDRR